MQGPSSSASLRRSSGGGGGGGSYRLIYCLAAAVVLMMAVPMYVTLPLPPQPPRPRFMTFGIEPCRRYLFYRIHSASSLAFAPSLSPWVSRSGPVQPGRGVGDRGMAEGPHWNEGDDVPRHRQNVTAAMAAAAPAAVAAALDPNIELPLGRAIAVMITGQVLHVMVW